MLILGLKVLKKMEGCACEARSYPWAESPRTAAHRKVQLKTKFVLEFKRSFVKENVRIVCLLEFPSVINENFDCNQISPVGGAKEGLKWLVLHWAQFRIKSRRSAL